MTTDNLWGRGPGAVAPIEDNMRRVDASLIQDGSSVLMTSYSFTLELIIVSRNPQNVWIKVFNDTSRIVNDALSNGAQLAIVACANKGL